MDWTPALIEKAIWLDASDKSTIDNLTSISQWSDKSGNGRHATQATSGNRPTFNDLSNSVAFNGSQWLSYDGSFLANTEYMIFAVAARMAAGSQYILGGSGSATNANLHFGWRDASQVTLAQFGNDINAPGSTPVGTFLLLVGSLGPSGKQLRTNGNVGASDAVLTKMVSSAGQAIAQFGASPARYQISVGELIAVTNYDLGILERVEGYLAHRWGLASNLPSDHPYKNSAPALIGTVLNKGYVVDTSLGEKDFSTPPSPKAGDKVRFSDYAGTFGTYNLTISPSDKPIRGALNSIFLNQNNQAAELTFFDDTIGWLVTG